MSIGGINMLENVYRKIKRNNAELAYIEELEKKYNQLKEEIAYRQRFFKIAGWTLNLQTDEFNATDELYNILDCSPEDIDGQLDKFFNFVHPDDKGELIKVTHEGIEGKDYDIEYRIITKRGTEKYLHEKSRIIRDENNNPIKLIGIIQDISGHKIVEKNLKELGDYLNRAQRVAGVGSFKYDAIKDILYVSEEVFKVYGIDPLEFKGDMNGFISIVHPEDQAEIEKAINNCLLGKPYNIKHRIPQKDGSIKYTISKGDPLHDEENRIIGIIETIQDITQNELLRQKIDREHKMLVNAQRIAGIASWEMEVATRKLYVSEELYRLLGIEPSQFDGTYKGFLNFVHPDDRDLLNKSIQNQTNEPVEMEFRIIRLDGSVRNFYLLLEIVFDDKENPIRIYGTSQDITEKKELENRMEYILKHDELTGLPNKYFLNQKIYEYALYADKNQTRFALMMIDIDGLKKINYALGYETGNQAILKIVNKMKMFLGEDTFLARYSDDHFVIIVPGHKTRKEYDALAKGLINLFKDPVRVDIFDLDLAANIGICIYNQEVKDMDFFRKQAKIALFRAKREGKNTHKFYSSDLDIKHYKEINLITDLHHIIENEQLKIHYQPIVKLNTNDILAVEALARWEHPEWGMVYPDEFIPLAEETELIIDIGKWMLREVCRQYKEWQSRKLDNFKVSLNFSNIQFLEKDFVKIIENIINEFGLDPSFLIIEIKESELIKNLDKVNNDINKLRSLGVLIALEFGTTLSSLSQLMLLNIDILKIDGAFIKNIALGDTSTVITKNIINMANELNIQVVAKRIEKIEQLSALNDYKCYAGQGFIYGKPVPLEDIEKILAQGKCKPIIASDEAMYFKERRKLFRVKFHQPLEADMTIKEIQKKKINIGNIRVLIKNIGAGGLCFISNIRLPLEKDIILQIITELIGQEIKIFGILVWMKEIDCNLYEYGVEFIINENERTDLITILNQVQVKIRNDILFADGRFTSHSPNVYFKLQ